MSYLHTEAKYAHLDLKPENILMTGDMKIKISDLGLSHSIKRPCDKKVGTPTYMAPEVYDFSG